MKIHTGDTVLIITGKDKGKTGTVVRVLGAQNRLVIQGINMRTRHIKKTTQQAGQRIKYEASIHASNVMLVDPKSKKPTRIGYKVDAKGKKVRIALVSGAVIEKAAPVKQQKPAKKGAKTEKMEKKDGEKDATPAADVATGKAPNKSPFWKRMGFGSEAAADGSGGESTPTDAAAPTQTTVRRSSTRGS